MRAALLFALALSIGAAACAAAPPRPETPHPATADRIAGDAALVQAGCFDCLKAAFADYRAMAAHASDPQWADRARQVAGLLAIRERALGFADEHYLEQARDGVGPDDQLFTDVIATLPRRTAGQQFAGDEAQIAMLRTVFENRERWRAALLDRSGTTPLAAITALAFECTHGGGRGGPALDPILERIGDRVAMPLVEFSRATCAGLDLDRLKSLLDSDARFVEVRFYLGVAATLAGDLEGADAHFATAYAWHPEWPAVTLALGNLAMTAEDFDRAAGFYDRTLALVPGNPDAQLGRVRALSYGGRYQAALAATDELLAGGRWYMGDARFWRAWNETQVNRIEEAWADVHEAAKLVMNAEVPKLTGILAIRRGDLAEARAELAVARARNPDDCETGTLLGGTELELRNWHDAGPVLAEAAGCLDKDDARIAADIERLRARPGRERAIARREQEVVTNQRLRTQCWFNLAVAATNDGDAATAREYAQRVADDERFGERARRLLDRLKPR